MALRLLAAGDSYTWGNELEDCHGFKHSMLTHGAISARRLGADYFCCARGGCGNHAISRLVIKTVEDFRLTNCFTHVSVMWTYPLRQEVKLDPHIADYFRDLPMQILDFDDWIIASPFQAQSLEYKLSVLPMADDEYWRDKLKKEHEAYINSGVANYINAYFAICNDKYGHLYQTCENILLTQTFLQNSGVNYRFSTSCNELLEIFEEPRLKPFTRCFDMSKWVNLDYGFEEWASIQKFDKHEGGHPVAAAHEAWVEAYADKFNW